MLRNLTLFLLLSFSFPTAFAQTVQPTDAGKVATAFMHSRLSISQTVPFSSLHISELINRPSQQSALYIANFKNGGYVIVAGDWASVPVLGYAVEGSYSELALPPAALAWLNGYAASLDALAVAHISPTGAISQAWNDLLNYNPDNASAMRGTRQVSPLLNTTWDQGARYNDLCPEDAAGPGGHVWSGCVATAMSQIINYWRFPLQGTGSHGYNSDYGYLSVNFGQSAYDFNQMNNNIAGESNYEMSEIQYHCGVAVDMMYSPSGSGAYSDDAAAALRNYFNYSSDLNLEDKGNYSDAEWADLLMQNLDNGWPMYYHGFGSGGHAFNVDGYQGTDYFHFNWGWSGSFNGYFYLNNLNPGGNNFTYGQGAIVNFHPGDNYPYYCSGVTTLTRHNGTIEDGSGPTDPYVSGLNCGWLIAPEDSVSNLTLVFDKFDVTQGIDVINVYDGPNAGYPLLGSFSGSAMPPALTASGDKLYIEFMTSGSQGSGWRARYNSTVVSYCSGITTLTAPEGTISDGSGPRTYHNNTICKYKILPENATSITLSFTSFDTEADADVLKVYDYVTQQLIGTYSGSDIPQDIVVPSSKAYVIFTTNDAVEGQGWELNYSSTITGTEQFYGNQGTTMSVSPNPADKWIKIDLSAKMESGIEVMLMSADGRMVLPAEHWNATGHNTFFINTSSLSNGLYFLEYRIGTETGTMKVMVNH